MRFKRATTPLPKPVDDGPLLMLAGWMKITQIAEHIGGWTITGSVDELDEGQPARGGFYRELEKRDWMKFWVTEDWARRFKVGQRLRIIASLEAPDGSEAQQ